SLLSDGNVYDRAVKDYGLDLNDEPEEMMRKVSKAAQDQVTINSLISKYPAVNITSNMSLDDARELIRNSTGDDLETITQDGKIYSFNKTTGELILLSGEEDARKYDLQIDENGNLVKVYEQDESYKQMIDAVDGALTNLVGAKYAAGVTDYERDVTGGGPAKILDILSFGIGNREARAKIQDFIADTTFLSTNLTLDALKKAKEEGATFGALSDNELTMLAASASKLGTYEIKEDGKVVGYNTSTESVLKEINRIKELLQKAAGPSTEIVEKSGKQLVSEAYTKTPEVRNAINAMVDAGLSYDDISEALNLKQPESGSGEIKTYETGAKAGQCGVYINKTAGIRVGNNKQDKINNVDKYGSKGTSGIKEGDVIVQNIGTYGHVALVTSVNPDGTVTLSESNYKNDEKVTNNRKISLNDTSIYGYLRPSNQTSNTLLI
ncbi:MAG: CHAP domain-containing protein, partial [Bacteroidia bacterium]|nr:CHAP domain-containing protein [Bacteroidia bacterium]